MRVWVESQHEIIGGRENVKFVCPLDRHITNYQRIIIGIILNIAINRGCLLKLLHLDDASGANLQHPASQWDHHNHLLIHNLRVKHYNHNNHNKTFGDPHPTIQPPH